jgi:hypothetical protein
MIDGGSEVRESRGSGCSHEGFCLATYRLKIVGIGGCRRRLGLKTAGAIKVDFRSIGLAKLEVTHRQEEKIESGVLATRGRKARIELDH